MTNRNRRRLPWFLGVLTLSVSLVVANQFLRSAETTPPANAPPGGTLPRPGKVVGTAPPGGITVKGIVDAPDGIARVDAPATQMPSLTVREVLVKEGSVVKVGDPLIQFDDIPFVQQVKQAEAALLDAQWQAALAQHAQRVDNPKKTEQQERAVRVAELDYKFAEDGYQRGRDIFENLLRTEKIIEGGNARPLTDLEKDKRRRENLELLKAEGLLQLLKEKVEKEKLELKRLNAVPGDAELGRAQANVALCEARKKQAEDLVKACLVTAKVAGVVEQITANAGMTFGPATRTPVLLIVPSGKRVVRAEVEAEFAFKIADSVGKPVTVYDDHNFNITYPGKVKRISPAFLPRRASGESFSMGPTNRVLEVLIEVTDPTPPGKPPLLPGLPVRVGFGN